MALFQNHLENGQPIADGTVLTTGAPSAANQAAAQAAGQQNAQLMNRAPMQGAPQTAPAGTPMGNGLNASAAIAAKNQAAAGGAMPGTSMGAPTLSQGNASMYSGGNGLSAPAPPGAQMTSAANGLAATGSQPLGAAGGNPNTAPNQWGTQNVATVGAPPTPSEYMSTLQAAYAPAFQQSQQALNANQAALGTLYSGAGNYGQQELQAQDAATLAQGELPLIQQGYGQQFQANQDNANATNSSLQQIQGEGATQALQTQQLQNTDSLYNAGQYNNVLGGNTSATNNYLGTQSGYANGQYGSAIGDEYGLLEGQQSGQSSIYGDGAGQAVSAYQTGQAAGTENTNNSDQGLGDLGGELFSDALATGAV